MNETAVIEIGREALWVTIQEITLTFVPKIIVIFFALIFFLPFMMTEVVEFSQVLFDRIVALGSGG